MRVLVVNDLPLEGGPGSGGAEVYARRVVSGLRAAGDEVSVFTRPGPRGRFGRALTMWDPFVRRALRARVREFGPDVVHLNNVFRELSGSVFGALSGVPTVMTVHDLRVIGVTMGAGSRARNALDRRVKQPLDTRLARRHVDLMLPVSADIAGRLEAAGFRSVRAHPVPAPTPVGRPAPPSTSTTVLFVGRLSTDKGVDVLLDAWPRIVAAVPDASLAIAGAGPEEAALTARAARVPHARMLGRLTESGVSAALGTARVLVVPSLPTVRPEGAPLVVVEAAMHGRPVVTSDDPGLAELVGRLGHGVVTPAGDAAALATAIVDLLGDDERVDRLGAHGRAEAEAYTTANVVAGLREIYATVTGKH